MDNVKITTNVDKLINIFFFYMNPQFIHNIFTLNCGGTQSALV